MRRTFTLQALAVVLLLLVTACGQDDADPVTSPDDAATFEPGEQMQATAWFVRFNEDADFWVEPERAMVAKSEGVARAAMEYLFGADPVDPARFNFAAAEVLDVALDSGVLTVDVTAAIDPDDSGHSSTEERAFAQQLAYTATQFPDVHAVRLLVEGQPVQDLWGHLDWSEPIEPAQFAETPIVIDSPTWGQTLAAGALTARGEANTFEASLAVRLIDPTGQVVEEQWIMATSGSGTRGTWSHTFASPLESPGMWVVEAEEPDPSGGAEGRKPLVVRIEFQVT